MCCEAVGSSEGVLLRLTLKTRRNEEARVLLFDESMGTICEGERECVLTLQEAKVLGALICHAGRSVNTAELVSHVWQWGSKHVLYTGISRAKRRMLAAGIKPFWEIRWGFGYAVLGSIEELERDLV